MAAQEVKGGQSMPASKSSSFSASRGDGPTMLGAEERNQMIAEAAYYKAEQRGFAAGGELDDWLAAEQEVKVSLEGVPAGRAPTVAKTAATGAAPASPTSPEQKTRLSV